MEPALRFVDTVTLAIDGDAWPAWCAALASQRWPWRRMSARRASPHSSCRSMHGAVAW